jgi:hypothetical protein
VFLLRGAQSSSKLRRRTADGAFHRVSSVNFCRFPERNFSQNVAIPSSKGESSRGNETKRGPGRNDRHDAIARQDGWKLFEKIRGGEKEEQMGGRRLPFRNPTSARNFWTRRRNPGDSGRRWTAFGFSSSPTVSSVGNADVFIAMPFTTKRRIHTDVVIADAILKRCATYSRRELPLA